MFLLPIYIILIFLIGLAVGSFLNSVIYRLEIGESFLIKRSYCPNCKHILSWPNLIPLISFLIQKGRCRYCQQKISPQYPLVELVTGILFLFTFLFVSLFNLNYYTLLYLFTMISFLIVIFVYDLKHYIIPDKVIYPAIGIALLYRFFEVLQFGRLNLFSNWKLAIGNLLPLTSVILSAVGAALFFLLIVLASRGRWMGIGDIKVAFLMGLILGFPDILVALFLAFFFGAIIGIGLVVCGKKTIKSEVPFAPFLVTATFIALFCGQQIINWYLNFLIF